MNVKPFFCVCVCEWWAGNTLIVVLLCYQRQHIIQISKHSQYEDEANQYQAYQLLLSIYHILTI